jgi:hypothetical protein
MMMKTPTTTPSSPSLLLPVVSNSRRSPPLQTSYRSDLCQTWQIPHGQQEKKETGGITKMWDRS